MAIRAEAKRVKTGQALTDFEVQGTNAVNVLKGIRTNLNNLKTLCKTDADFGQADIDEVDAMIVKLNTAIDNI